MRRKEVERKFDEFVDSSGTAKLLDTPVTRYASGPIPVTLWTRLAWKIEEIS